MSCDVMDLVDKQIFSGYLDLCYIENFFLLLLWQE